MKIEKIKNYNQKVLAIVGTAIGIMLVVLIVSVLILVFSQIRWNQRRWNSQGLLSEKKIEELRKENKRQQIISYDVPKLIDTLNKIYVIPVSHKTLNEPEDIEMDANLEIAYAPEASMYGYKRVRFSHHFYGQFNNLIIYDMKDHNINKLFDNRISFDEILVEYFDDDILVLFTAANKDTNKDELINYNDLNSLYIYSVKKEILKNIAMENAEISHFSFIGDDKDLLIQFGVDRDKNGEYAGFVEPQLVKKYNYTTSRQIDIIDEKTNLELQEVLDGSNK